MKIETERDYVGRWIAYDSDEYDGADDSPSRQDIGRGSTQAEAVEDLLERLSYREERKAVRRD